MKAIVLKPVEVEIKYLKIQIPIRSDSGDDVDSESYFPLQKNGEWDCLIDIDSGQILNYNYHKGCSLDEKVVDSGYYYLLDENMKEVYSIEQGYVPNKLIPGEFGDYINLCIDDNGLITNWPKGKLDISEFIPEYED